MTRNDAGRRPILGIIVGSGDLPQALQKAAESIVGSSQGLVVASIEDFLATGLDSGLDRLVKEHSDKDILIFVDLYGSSCSHASARIKRAHPEIQSICGVNLPMLVRFLQHRNRLSFSELVDLMLRTGLEEIRPGPV